MPKQITEGIFRKSVKACNKYYILKLQVNVMAHCKTLCDYLVFSKKYNYAVECKQVTISDKNKFYTFDRLTQKDLLIQWQDFSDLNKSYVFIGFIREKKKVSSFYLVPLNKYFEFEADLYDRKASCEDYELFLGEYFTPYIGKDMVNLGDLLE